MPSRVFKQMEKNEDKNRTKRKYRGPWRRSRKGHKGAVLLKNGDKKTVNKRFYFTTYASNGDNMGTFWFTSTKVNSDTVKQYKKVYGVKHPAKLPVVHDKGKKWPNRTGQKSKPKPSANG